MIGFASPLALLALLAVVPVAAALAYQRHRDRLAGDAFGGDRPLRLGLSPLRRQLRLLLVLAAIALTAIAIARPQWGEADQPLVRKGIDIVIALDVSRSMTAPDVAPTRARAAAEGLGDLLDHLRGDRVGLVNFAGSAFMRSPLTLDLGAIRQLVDQAQGEATLLRPGSDLSAAMQESLRVLDIDDAAASQVIVIVSDGEEQTQASLQSTIDRVRLEGVRVYTVAAGTDVGVDIPLNRAGATEHTALDRDALERIADGTGGGVRDTSSVAGLAVEFSRLRQSQFDEADQRAPIDRFQWFVAAALVLLMLQTLVAEGSMPAPLRATRITIGSLALLLATVVACGGSAAYTHVSSGNDAYDDGQFDDALTEYRLAADLQPDDPSIAYDTGNALHRLRRFEEATAASSVAATTTEDREILQRATYALGSHAAERGALEEARAAFIDVLRRDPDDDDARHNLEMVLLAMRPPAPDSPPEPDTPNPSPPATEPPAGATPEPDGSSPDGDSGSGTSDESGTESGTGQADDVTPGAADPGGEQVLAGVQQQLTDALVDAGTAVTLDQALEILDLLRRVNTLVAIEDSGSGSGNFPAR